MDSKKDKSFLLIEKIFKISHINISKKNIELFTQIFKFIIVGGIATVIDFLCIFIFKEIFGIPVILSNTLAFIIATVYNYIASISWVYNVDKEKDKKKTFILFVTFSSVGLIISDVIIWITFSIFNIHYMIGKVIATCFVMVFNFITRKLFLE